MYRCDIISWLVRLPTFEPSVLEPRATFEPGPKGLREPKATFEPRVLEPRATLVPKCMCRCDIISWLVRLPTLEPRVLEPRTTFEPGPMGLRDVFRKKRDYVGIFPILGGGGWLRLDGENTQNIE